MCSLNVLCLMNLVFVPVFMTFGWYSSRVLKALFGGSKVIVRICVESVNEQVIFNRIWTARTGGLRQFRRGL